MIPIDLGSYTRRIQYKPDHVKNLELFLNNRHNNRELLEFTNNMIIKFGFVMYAKDQLEQVKIGKQIESAYHFCNFVFYTKAFLDSTANVLNSFYKLKNKKGEIDICKCEFREDLRKGSTILADYLVKKRSWLDEVVDIGNKIIHRFSPSFVYASPPNETGKAPANLEVKYKLKSIIQSLLKPKSNKHGWSNMTKLINRWYTESENLLKITCEDLVTSET